MAIFNRSSFAYDKVNGKFMWFFLHPVKVLCNRPLVSV